MEETGVRDIYDTEAHDVYDAYDMYERLDREEEERPTDLSRSIEVFADSHAKYLDALINLKENYVEKTDSYFLKRHFFSHLQVDELIDLHTELAKEIEHLKFDYKRISLMFQMFEEKFLVYGEVLAKCFSVIENFQNIMAFNPELKEEMKRLKRECKSNDDLIDMIQKIAQHIMRYKSPYLEDIRRQARKASATKIEDEASKAYEKMQNMLDHFNDYHKDYTNILTMAELGTLYNYSLKQFGRMYLEVEDVEVTVKSHPIPFKKYHLYIFEEVLVVFGLQASKKYSFSSDGQLDRNFLGEAKHVQVLVHKPLGTFYFKDGYEVRNKDNKIIEMNTYDNITAKCDKQKSFKMKFPNQDAQNRVYEKIRELCNEADKEREIRRGSDHPKHQFEIFRNRITEEHHPEDHMKCAECQEYMGGKMFKCIHCLTCNAYYHMNCFQIIKEENEYGAFGFVPELESKIREEDFNLGEKTNEEAKNLLLGKRNGTFLVRKSVQHGHFFINYNENKKKKDLTIRTEQIKGNTLFYIDKGFASDSILELVIENKLKYNLLYPVHSPEADVKDEDVEFGRKVSTTDAAINETEEEDFNNFYYNHGYMNEDEAEKILQNKQKGVFIIRYLHRVLLIAL